MLWRHGDPFPKPPEDAPVRQPGSRRILAFIAALVVATRLVHSPLVWSEEAYPAAAAIQILHGLVPYRDFFYDKPPLAPLFYLLIGAATGWPLRILGALFVVGCAWLARWAGTRMWSRQEGAWAFVFVAFFLTFDFPSAAIPLTPDLLLVAPHLGVICLLLAGRPLAAGVVSSLAFLVNPKGLLVLLLCLVWRPRSAGRILAGFAGPVVVTAGVLSYLGALIPFWQQVWVWGSAYAADTPWASPWREGILRTASWIWFHGTLAAAAVVYFRRRSDDLTARLGIWLLLSLVGVALGWRFFPRYYFQLLPVMALIGARGILLLPARSGVLLLALSVIPLVRFGPRYLTLAVSGDAEWSDTAMDRDSRAAAERLAGLRGAGDTIMVWGYRPDLLVRTRLRLGVPYLDSQPLTGVLADRHLTSDRATFPDMARANRSLLPRFHPTFIVDGLGPYHSRLAITEFPELRPWLEDYRVAARTSGCVIYRRTAARQSANRAAGDWHLPSAERSVPARSGAPP